VSTGPVSGYRGHGTPTRNSPPQLAPRREIYLTRAGKRAVSKETWRVLDTSDGRFAVWGVSEPLTPRRSSSAPYVTRLRIVRLPHPVAVQCSAERWDGWEGTAECRKTATRHIAGADRRCDSDSDCVLLGTSCDAHAASAKAASRYRAWPLPCTPPGAGNCAGPRRAVCDRGCCYPDLPGRP
jgi:hypothetical protein